jgi:hypothetical protein
VELNYSYSDYYRQKPIAGFQNEVIREYTSSLSGSYTLPRKSSSATQAQWSQLGIVDAGRTYDVIANMFYSSNNFGTYTEVFVYRYAHPQAFVSGVGPISLKERPCGLTSNGKPFAVFDGGWFHAGRFPWLDIGVGSPVFAVGYTLQREGSTVYQGSGSYTWNETQSVAGSLNNICSNGSELGSIPSARPSPMSVRVRWDADTTGMTAMYDESLSVSRLDANFTGFSTNAMMSTTPYWSADPDAAPRIYRLGILKPPTASAVCVDTYYDLPQVVP